MTRDEILALSGPELNAAVAERLGWQDISDFAGDIAAAFLMEERIDELLLGQEYGDAILSLQPGRPPLPDLYGVFGLVHAPPLTRCRAALMALTP